MPRTADHTHRINIRPTQLEMHPDGPVGSTPLGEELEGRLEMAQQELVQLQQQREELERRKRELEELNRRKKEFLGTQAAVIEKLTNAVTQIDRELYALREELDDLEQTRQCFAEHITRINKLDPEAWPRQNVAELLERALAAIHHAEEEFQQAAQHFEGMRSAVIFGRKARRQARPAGPSEFAAHLRNGFAFNLPILLLGTAAIALYLLK